MHQQLHCPCLLRDSAGCICRPRVRPRVRRPAFPCSAPPRCGDSSAFVGACLCRSSVAARGWQSSLSVSLPSACSPKDCAGLYRRNVLTAAATDAEACCRNAMDPQGHQLRVYDPAVHMFWKNVQARAVDERAPILGRSPVTWLLPADATAGEWPIRSHDSDSCAV